MTDFSRTSRAVKHYLIPFGDTDASNGIEIDANGLPDAEALAAGDWTPLTVSHEFYESFTIVAAAAATPAEFSRDRTIFDTGAALGQSAASVPVAGTTNAADGQPIEARAVTESGSAVTGWTQIGAAAAGTFFGTLTVPLGPEWMRLETRVAGESATRQTARSFAAGHVWAIYEQSNGGKIFTDIPPNAASLYAPVAREGDVQLIHRSAPGTVVPVTEAAKESTPVSPAAVDLANALSALRPGEKFLLVLHVKTGTSLYDAFTTTAEHPDGARDWLTEEKVMHETATADGSPVGVAFVPGWIESHIGFGGNIPLHFMEAFTGFTEANVATDFDIFGQTFPRLPVRIDAAGATVSADGFYDMRETRFCYFGPHGNDLSGLPDASSYADISDLPLASAMQEYAAYQGIIENARTYLNASTNSAVLDWPGESAGAYRPSNDTLHHASNDADGFQRLAAIWAFLMAKAAGLHDMDKPTLTDRYDNPAGAYSDFWMDGIDLTTERLRRGQALPAAVAPHHTEVMGWTINDVAVERAEIVTASGHPLIPDGQAFCRVWPNSGSITAADKIVYGQGVLPGYYVAEDYDRKTVLDWLVADPGLPASYPIAALPLDIQHSSPLATTLALPDLYAVDGTTHYRNSSNTEITSFDQAYAEFFGRFEDVPVNNRVNILGVGPQFWLQLNGVNGALHIRDNFGLNVSSAAGVIVQGVFYHIGVRVDVTAGTIEVIDRKNSDAIIVSTNAARTTGLTTGRVDFFKVSGKSEPNVTGTFAYMRVWLGQLDHTGTASHSVDALPTAPHFQATGVALNAGNPPTDGVA